MVSVKWESTACFSSGCSPGLAQTSHWDFGFHVQQVLANIPHFAVWREREHRWQGLNSSLLSIPYKLPALNPKARSCIRMLRIAECLRQSSLSPIQDYPQVWQLKTLKKKKCERGQGCRKAAASALMKQTHSVLISTHYRGRRDVRGQSESLTAGFSCVFCSERSLVLISGMRTRIYFTLKIWGCALARNMSWQSQRTNRK